VDKMRMESVDLTHKNIEKIYELFPSVVTEKRGIDGKIKKAVNFELLKQILADEVVEGDEAYEFTWVGKKEAIAEAGRPIKKTLRPCKEDSKEWDTTENIYIEGDNLQVLKLLQESYLKSINLIYIDPPYNTGKDFIYPDNFLMNKETYDESSNYFNENGEINFSRLNNNLRPRFHSDWCSMIYSRLLLARNLLTDDGAIFISIDENEDYNLREMCDEVFGEDNFVAEFVWSGGRKNDSQLVSVSHEYMICYAKNKSYLKENNISWRERKEGIEEIYAEYARLKKIYQEDYATLQNELKQWYKNLADNHPAKNHSHYSSVDARGIYFPADISWPGGGGPKYEVLHPITNNPVKLPSRGWIYGSTKMNEMMNSDMIHFGKDENSVPCIKTYLRDKETAAPYSVFYKDGRGATKRLRTLMSDDVFQNPKDEEIIQKIIQFANMGGGRVLDFFSGSGTTAHSVFLQNIQDNKNRNFIMVQLPEDLDEQFKNANEKAKKTLSKAIRLLDKLHKPHLLTELGKERIRRAGDKIIDENKETEGIGNLDFGFRVFKLDDSNMKDIYYSAGEYTQATLEEFISNIKEDRTDLDLLYGCLLEWGLPLSLPHISEEYQGVTIHTVNSGDLIACFDPEINEDIVREIAKRQPLRVVFRDSSFENSPAKINVGEIFKLLAPNTRVKVI